MPISSPQDVYDGRVIKEMIMRDPRFREDPRCIMLGLVTDPFQPFKDDAKYSPCPFLIVNMNLEPQLRYTLGVGCHMVAISRGVTDDDVSKDPYTSVLDIITDELDWLDRVGFDTSDAHTREEHVHLFAKVTIE
jgi:hypothetical protein